MNLSALLYKFDGSSSQSRGKALFRARLRETRIFGNTRKPAICDVFNKFCANTCDIQVGFAVSLEVGIQNTSVTTGRLPCVEN